MAYYRNFPEAPHWVSSFQQPDSIRHGLRDHGMLLLVSFAQYEEKIEEGFLNLPISNPFFVKETVRVR